MWQRYKIPAYPPNYPVKKEDPRESGPVSRFLSPAIEDNFPPIIFRTHGEVDPIGGATLLEDELVEILTIGIVPFVRFFIGDIQQNPRHADHLLRAITLDIHRTTSEMIRTLRTSTKAINLFAPIPRENDDGDLISTVF